MDIYTLIAFIVFILLTLVVIYLTFGKSRKRGFLIWGLFVMFIGAYLVASIVANVIPTNDSWGALGLFVETFITLFLLGLILTVIGLFLKRKPTN